MKYDVAVIGGGPSGMMAAIVASLSGASVVLLEKNDRLGVKLLLAGGGRCNIANKIENISALIENYGQTGKFLFSALNKYGVEYVEQFFETRDVPLKVEDNNKIFPKSNKAQDILNCLLDELAKNDVTIIAGIAVANVKTKDGVIEKINLVDKQEIEAGNYIFAFGGKSYPKTGSSGDGYAICRKLGHTVVELKPGLAPLILENNSVKGLEGVSLSDVAVSAFVGTKEIVSVSGDIIFTAKGISGPAAINLSNSVSRETARDIEIKLDFFPDLKLLALDKKLLEIFQRNNNRELKNGAENLLPARLWEFCLVQALLNPNKKINLVTAQERGKIVAWLKDCRFKLKNVGWFDEAMITLGGIDLKEIDPKTMGSKIIKNLYFSGEVLDLAGPTGGFNLQICWSTGALAGENAALT